MSINSIKIEQITIAARCMEQLLKSGMTENMAIRHLEFLANVYAKFKTLRKVSVDHVDEFAMWSAAAIRAKKENPEKKVGEYLRVEHGTPRRKFAKLVFMAFKEKKLTERWMNSHCKKLWKVAVVTHEEDKKLNKLRKLDFVTPEARWTHVGIEIQERI